MTHQQLIEKLERVNLKQMELQAVSSVTEEAESANRAQLSFGQDSTGRKLRAYANRNYAEHKSSMSSLPGFGTPDLTLGDGGFHSKIYAKPKIKGRDVILEMDSSDRKRDWLIDGTPKMKPFGEDVFGLQKENRSRILEIGKKKLKELFNAKLGI